MPQAGAPDERSCRQEVRRRRNPNRRRLGPDLYDPHAHGLDHQRSRRTALVPRTTYQTMRSSPLRRVSPAASTTTTSSSQTGIVQPGKAMALPRQRDPAPRQAAGSPRLPKPPNAARRATESAPTPPPKLPIVFGDNLEVIPNRRPRSRNSAAPATPLPQRSREVVWVGLRVPEDCL